MKDTKESSSKLSDLFDDLQETLDSSIFNENNESSTRKFESIRELNPFKEKETEKVKETETVSELFDMLNSKQSGKDSHSRSQSQTQSEARRIISEAIDDNPSVNKYKVEIETANPVKTKQSKSAGAKHSKSKPSPVESFVSGDNKKDVGGISGIMSDDIEIEAETDIAAGENEIIDEIEIETEHAGGTANADMDLELLKAIGIGKQSKHERDDSDSVRGQSGTSEKRAKIKTPDEIGTPAKNRPVLKKPSALSLHKISNKEYSDRSQLNEIFEFYNKVYKSEIIRFVAGVVLFLLLLYMETAPYLNWGMPTPLNIKFYNQPYIYINLQLLLLVAALNHKSLIYGAKSMFASNINVYSISVFFFLIAFTQTIVTLIFKSAGLGIVMYNSTAAYSMIMAGLYTILDMNAEITSFRTVSSKKPKYALSMDAPERKGENPYRSSRLESELFGDFVPEDATVGGILKASFTSNFFSRTYRDKHSGGHIKYFVYISMLAAMALLVFYMIFQKDKDWYAFITSLAALMLGSVPLCSFIVNAYPVFKAQKKARETGSAFIGGKSLEESAETMIISLYDRDIFPPDQIKISGIKVYGNNRIDTVVHNLCVIFDKLNMPAADTFKSSTNFDGDLNNRNIKFAGIDDDGICCVLNNRKMYLGTPEYISNIGFLPQHDPNFDESFIKSLGSIMILASETEVVAKIYIKYEITADFHDIIKSIRKINACLCIRTFDPNINDEFLAKFGSIKKFPIKVLKLRDPADRQKTPDRIDSPVISKESVKSLINAVLIAVRAKSVMKSNVLIQTFAFGLSVLLAVILGFAGQLWGINAGHLFLLQSFFMLPVILLQGLTP